MHMPGNQGGSNWGSTAANPADGSVYVIGFNVPTLIRLLKPGEIRPGQRGGPPEVVKEGRYVTNGFGLYPTIVNPPYTTLTAYDLNRARSSGRSASATICVSPPRASPARARRRRSRAGIIVTGTGLLFVTAADRKVHVYDSATGKQIWELPLGGADERRAVDVRARRTAVPPRHRHRTDRPRRARRRLCSRGTRRHRGLRAAAELR